MIRQTELCRAQPPTTGDSANAERQTRSSDSKTSWFFTHHLIRCAILSLIVSGNPSDCKPLEQAVWSVASKAAPASLRASSAVPVSTEALAGAIRSVGFTLQGGERADVAETKEGGGPVTTASEQLASEEHKRYLPRGSSVHYSASGGWAQEKVSRGNGDVKPLGSFLERRQQSDRRKQTLYRQQNSSTASLIQEGAKAEAEDSREQIKEDDTTLRIPARFRISSVGPHLPLVETFSGASDSEDEAVDERHPNLPLVKELVEAKGLVPALVEASSTAEEKTNKQSSDEGREEAEGAEGQSAEQENHSNAEKESSKEEENAKSGKSSDESEQADSSQQQGDEAGASASEKDRGRAQQVASNSEDRPSTQRPSSPKAHAANGDHTEHSTKGAPTEEDDEQHSSKESVEAQGHTDEEYKASGHGNPNSEAEASVKSVSSQSKVEGHEPKVQDAEEAEKEEHHKQVKELAEQATKLANIQRMEVRELT